MWTYSVKLITYVCPPFKHLIMDDTESEQEDQAQEADKTEEEKPKKHHFKKSDAPQKSPSFSFRLEPADNAKFQALMAKGGSGYTTTKLVTEMIRERYSDWC